MKIAPSVKITAIITLSVLLVLWYFFEYRSDKEIAAKDIEDQQKQVPRQQQPNYTPGEFQAMANDIEAALDRWGTDEELLFSTFGKLLNDADAHALNATFGLRSDRSLGSWLQSDSEYKAIEDLLTAKGITYRFNIIDNSPFYDL